MAKKSYSEDPLGELLNEQRKEAITTDITLVCEEKEFPAHKIILSSRSDYFKAMFSSGWNDSRRNSINLLSIGAEEMDIILSFLYLGKLKDVEDHGLLVAIIEASHFLQIKKLFKYSWERSFKRMNCSCFLDMINLGFQYHNDEMITHVVSFLAQNFEDVAESEEFLDLNACQMEKICQHHDILKSSFDIVIRGLFRWTEVEEGRENSLLKILTILDLHRLSTVFLSEILREWAIVKKNYHILTLLTAEATSRTLTLSVNSTENPNKTKILTIGEKEQAHVFRTYDIKKNVWSSPQIIPFHLSMGACTAWFAGHVYIFGGLKNGSEELNDEESDRYNETHGCERSVSDNENIREEDERDAANVNQDNVYEEPTAKIIKYCPANNTVSSFGKLAIPVYYAGTGVLDEYIYIVNGGNAVPMVQRYDPVTGNCKTVSPCKKRRHWPRVLPYSKYLLILESDEGESSIERYDPKHDKWVIITEIPELIDRCSAAICEHKLYVLPVMFTYKFEVYDLISGTWTPKEFRQSPNRIYDLFSIRFEGKSILVVRDDKKALHSFDPISKTWFTKSARNDEPWGKCGFWTTNVAEFS